eukprot:6940201-Prymnesium_polylepis.1
MAQKQTASAPLLPWSVKTPPRPKAGCALTPAASPATASAAGRRPRTAHSESPECHRRQRAQPPLARHSAPFLA